MARILKIRQVQKGFFLSSALLVAVLITPRLGGDAQLWINGLYESFAVIVGIPERVVKNISNHKDKSSFRRYVKLEGSYLCKELRKWNRGA